jgi:hypothetical protein
MIHGINLLKELNGSQENKNIGTAHNRSVSAAPPTSGGSGSIRLGHGLSPFPRLIAPDFRCPGNAKAGRMDCLCVSLFGHIKPRKQPERYAPFCLLYLKLSKNNN